ncbi:MAG: oligosaccharide flippase family protein [Melioribacteraceae bacterium]
MPSDKQNSSWLSFQFVVTLIFSLLTLKLNLNHFGEQSFGIWILLASIWGFGAVLDFGFNTAIVKHVAEFKEDNQKVNRLISSSFFVFAVNGFVILILGSSAGYFAYFTNPAIIQERSQNYFITVFALLGISFYLQYISLFFKAVVEGLSNFILSSKLTIVQNSLILLGTILITYADLSLISLSILYLIVYVIILSSYFFYFRFSVKVYTIKYSLFDFSEVKRILGFSLSVQAMTVFNSIIDPIIKYMLGTYLDIKIVPAYEIARRFALAVSGLFFNAFKIVLPKASILRTKNEIRNFIMDDLVNYSKMGITYSGMAFGIFSIAIVLIISAVFGIRDAILIFIILSLPESINNFGYPIYNFLLGQGKVRLLVVVQLTNLVFVVAGLFIGLNIFHDLSGLLGYFVSVLIGNILMVAYLKKKWNIPVTEFLGNCKIIKLGFLLVLLIAMMPLIILNILPIYLNFAMLSVISFILFFKEILYYLKIIRSSFSLHSLK